MLAVVVAVAALFALWTSLPESSKKRLLSRLGFEATSEGASPEVEALIRYYNDRAKDVEQEMAQAAEQWRQTGPADQTHPDWRQSITLLEEKRRRFRELHERHIEALMAGQLTLAQVYANSTNELLLGTRVAYDNLPGFRKFTSWYQVRQGSVDGTFAPQELTRILADRSNPDAVRLSAAQILSRHCDGSEQCMVALGAIFEFEGSYYMLWEGAQAKLCEAGTGAQAAIPALVKVLSHRDVYRDRRSWIFALETIACIGPPAAEAVVPHMVMILTKPSVDPNEYYDTAYIQEVAARSLGKLGKAAAMAIPALREAAKSAEPDVRNAAIKALRDIE